MTYEIQNGVAEETVPEGIEYLASSSNRVVALKAIVRDSGEPAELREGLEMPRSTFQRILSELQDRNWAEKSEGIYTATPLGEYVEGYFDDCVGTMSGLDKLSRFFEYVPFSEIGVGMETLVDSEITVSGSYSPHAPTERLIEALEDADGVRGLSPVITDRAFEAFSDAIADSGVTVKNVVEKKVADAIISRYTDRLDEIGETDETGTYVYDGEIPMGMMIIDDTVFVSAFDEDGIARVLLQNDTDRMLGWAEGYHDRYRRESEPLDLRLGHA